MTEEEDIQNQILQFQQLQQQFESISSTRAQMEHQFHEIEHAYEEVEKIDEKTPIYKAIGTLMVKAKNKLDVLKELLEKKETLQIRVESFKKQEKNVEGMLKQLSQEIQEKLKASQLAGAMGNEKGPMAG